MSSDFIKNFDPKCESHVKWLDRMITVAESLASSNLMQEINKNPMKIKLPDSSALEWPQIHFCLCGVYAKAVLRGKAWIPNSS